MRVRVRLVDQYLTRSKREHVTRGGSSGELVSMNMDDVAAVTPRMLSGGFRHRAASHQRDLTGGGGGSAGNGRSSEGGGVMRGVVEGARGRGVTTGWERGRGE